MNSTTIPTVSTEKYCFSAVGDKIIASDLAGQVVYWSKNFTKGKISQLLLSNAGDSLYVLYDYYQFQIGDLASNLLKINMEGNLLWVAEVPRSNDVYVQIRYHNNTLGGSTWDCWGVTINEENGQIIDATFTK